MSAPSKARQWILSNRPSGLPTVSGPNPTFSLVEKDLPQPKPGQVVLRTLYLSNDPAQRGWISGTIPPERLYRPPVEVGAHMEARAIAEITATTPEAEKAKPQLVKGAHVLVSSGWTEHSVQDASACMPIAPLPGGLSETHYLGGLGMTGMTAYYGLVEVISAKPTDAVVVSGAAGATGSMVVQIAKHVIGCKKVVGIAGSDDKCRWVEKLGADVCLNYKKDTFVDDLKQATTPFVECYFDNVGGSQLDLMLSRLAPRGRIAACGAISGYNSEKGRADPTAGIKNWFEIIANRLEIRGFIVMDFLNRTAEVQEVFRQALAKGKITLGDENETVVPTKFDQVPQTWMKLFEGSNTGKLVTKVE